MGRTLLRLAPLPLLAFFIVLDSASGPVPVLRWFLLALAMPFVVAATMVSFLEKEEDPPSGIVPLWARRTAPLLWGISVIAIISVVSSDWPLHRSFRTTKPQLEKLSLAVRQGKPLVWPRQVGNFNVTNIRVDEETVVFYLDGADDGDYAKIQHWFAPAAKEQRRKLEWRNDRNTVILDDEWLLYAAL